ncbi:hypothetical protein [Saccharothrix variisporea]|uniref:Uncharacterized protein n=1 Tax=Saccharothrix variisporea TaxID=543527 RepID=A0A495XNK4_9PSEU|nr:hypothetical protein [Saccharothrix variisporea]RKT74476.1 hypothetical protein DFJ66_7836 [Saccharothrix variisporea]
MNIRTSVAGAALVLAALAITAGQAAVSAAGSHDTGTSLSMYAEERGGGGEGGSSGS